MKFATYEHNGTRRAGLVDPKRGELLDLAQAANGKDDGAFVDMLTLIEAGDSALTLARDCEQAWPANAVLPITEVHLLAPLPRPTQFRDCLVFETHLRNCLAQWEKMTGKPGQPIAEEWYRRPTWYKGNRMSFVGPDHDVVWPSYSEKMDYELELACVIGKQGRDIAREAAWEHIFGLTIFNDFSARDIQAVERPLGTGPMKTKDFDTGNVMGPWIVTLDEFENPGALEMSVSVNGVRKGGGNSSEMQHDFPAILAFVSQSETLYPGELIASGTVGTGCGLEFGVFLEPGDVIELEVQGIGRLRNRIVRPFAAA